MNNPSELWMRRDHKHDYAFRPLEKALLAGTVDAIYTQSKVFQHLQEATGRIAMIEDLSRYADWRIQVANTPAVITCTDVMATEHPELVIAYMKAMIKVGRWANDNKRAAGAILNRQTFYLDAEDTYQGIKDVDMVPSLSARNLETHPDRQGLHGQPRLHQERLRRARVGPPRSSWSRRRLRSSRRSGSDGAGASCLMEADSRWKGCGSGRHARGVRRQPRPVVVPRERPPSGPRSRHIGPWCHLAPDQEDAMSRTALELVTEARAQLENLSPGTPCPKSPRVGPCSSMSGSQWSGSTTSRALSRCREGCSSSPQIRQARATSRSSTPPAE